MKNKSPQLVFYEVFREEQTALRNFLPKHIRARFYPTTIQNTADQGLQPEIISIRTQSRISTAHAAFLKGVLTRSQGHEHLFGFARRTKIPCGYLPCYCSRSVAEHAVMAMMALLRKLKVQLKNMRTFDRENIMGSECRGQKALVIGVGSIGSEMVDILKGLRMSVRGVDTVRRLKNLRYVSLSEGVAWADVIFCALPLTAKTKGILNYHLFKKAKKGLIFINISRGEISPIGDLRKLLEEKRLGGLSLDVYPQESLWADYLRGTSRKLTKDIRVLLALGGKDNVLFTPHNAFNTRESVERKAYLTIQSIKLFLLNGQFPQAVS